MIAEGVRVLACPVCGRELGETSGATGETSGTTGETHALKCARGHSFDIARQGYVNLLTSSKHAKNADTAEMVEARAEFLAAGHYEPIAEAIAAVVREHAGSAGSERAGSVNGDRDSRDFVIADAGAGTGYYLGHVLASHVGATGIALDISKYAARRAARVPNVISAVCDTWARLPLRDESVDALLDVFAPRNEADFARVLRAAGVLVVVTPRPGHLRELVEALGLVGMQADKQARVEATLAERFACLETRPIEYRIELTSEDAYRAAMMGPSAAHVDASDLRRKLSAHLADHAATLSASVAVDVTVFTRDPTVSGDGS